MFSLYYLGRLQMLQLFLLFTIVPIVELMLLFEAGDAIGGINTIFIVIITGYIGAKFSRSQGRALLRDLQLKLSRGEMPQDAMIEGFLVFAGGLLLLTPGFITDFLGLAMVIPFSRKLFIAHIRKMLKHQMQNGRIKFYSNSNGFQNTNSQSFYWSSTDVKQRNGQIHSQKDASNSRVYKQNGHDVIDVDPL